MRCCLSFSAERLSCRGEDQIRSVVYRIGDIFIYGGLLVTEVVGGMKGSIIFHLLAVGLLYGQTAGAVDQSFVVLEIEDGDTLLVEVKGVPKRIQLAGLDAPEDTVNPKLQRDMERSGLTEETLLSLGKAATAHLEKLAVTGESVRLVGDINARDKYGRTPMLAYDEAGNPINEAMIEDGFAVVLKRAHLDAEMKSRWQMLEQSAIDAGKGIWGNETRGAALKWSARTAL